MENRLKFDIIFFPVERISQRMLTDVTSSGIQPQKGRIEHDIEPIGTIPEKCMGKDRVVPIVSRTFPPR